MAARICDRKRMCGNNLPIADGRLSGKLGGGLTLDFFYRNASIICALGQYSSYFAAAIRRVRSLRQRDFSSHSEQTTAILRRTAGCVRLSSAGSIETACSIFGSSALAPGPREARPQSVELAETEVLSDVPAAPAPESIECAQVFLPLYPAAQARQKSHTRLPCNSSAHNVRQVARGRFDADQMSAKRSQIS